jgi:hypothetical protein
MPVLQDFQFFNIKRLTELFEKENNYEQFKQHKKADAVRAVAEEQGPGQAATQPARAC